MITMRSSFRAGLMAALLTSVQAAAAAGDLLPRVRLTDRADEHRMILTIGSVRTDASGAATIGAVTRLPRAVVVHRVTVQLDRTTAGDAGATRLSASLLTRTGAWLQPLLRMDGPGQALDLPRPLGLRMEAGQVLAVFGQLLAPGNTPFEVRIVLDYEADHAAPGRLAALPVHLPLAADSTGVLHAAWRAPVDGRILALTGIPAGEAGELVLVDLASGTIIWRALLHGNAAEAFDARASAVRAGAAVQAGRTYSLVLHLQGGLGTSTPVHALVVPVRPAALAASF